MSCKVTCNGAVSQPSILECYAIVDECDVHRLLPETLRNIFTSDLVKIVLILTFHVYCVNYRQQRETTICIEMKYRSNVCFYKYLVKNGIYKHVCINKG